MVGRHLPHGVCSGCGDETFLPPFGDGLCFLCATDGPPGERVAAIGAVHEDVDARRLYPELSERDEERRIAILDDFASHQQAWAWAIGAEHIRSQRFDTWTRARTTRRVVYSGPIGPTVEELRRRVAKRNAAKVRERAPILYREHIDSVRERRRGGGNYAPPELVARAIELRNGGASLRAIARDTGLCRPTVLLYVPPIDRSEAMRLMNVRLKAEGRPVLPPWARKTRGQDPPAARTDTAHGKPANRPG